MAVTAESPLAPIQETWEKVGSGPGSWYLDPLVAEQKRLLHAALLSPVPKTALIALKTDSFEEAFGNDSPLPCILPYARHWLVIDLAEATLRRAKIRHGEAAFLATDTRQIALRSASLDLVFSNSTLDHFPRRQEFERSVREIARTLRPGGRLVLTLDNPLNPLYLPLRWLCRTRWAPFPLGYTETPRQLRKTLQEAGFEIESNFYLIHNPRIVSTLLYMILRRLLKKRADGPIRFLLAAFQTLDKLPTRPLTACYHGVIAVRSSGSHE